MANSSNSAKSASNHTAAQRAAATKPKRRVRAKSSDLDSPLEARGETSLDAVVLEGGRLPDSALTADEVTEGPPASGLHKSLISAFSEIVALRRELHEVLASVDDVSPYFEALGRVQTAAASYSEHIRAAGVRRAISGDKCLFLEEEVFKHPARRAIQRAYRDHFAEQISLAAKNNQPLQVAKLYKDIGRFAGVPRADSAILLVGAFYKTRQYAEVISLFERRVKSQLKQRPDLAEDLCITAYATALTREGRPSEAEAFLMEIEPNFPNSWRVLTGLALLRMRSDPRSAEGFARRVVEAGGGKRSQVLNLLVAAMVARGASGDEVAQMLQPLNLPKTRHVMQNLHFLRALASGLSGEVDAQLASANRYFAASGLSEIKRPDPTQALSIWNIGPADVKPVGLDGPLVTVIMTTFNSAATVRGAIMSILGQTWKNIELIVCDDCSEDETVAIIKDIRSRDKRISIIQNKKNVGT